MDYAEHPVPPALAGLVAAIWTASVPADGPTWIAQEAVPDGCVELIRRHAGRSRWRRDQPAVFATGLATVTAKLEFGAGAGFTAIKLWPWAWHALGGQRCASFADDWIPIADPRLVGLLDGDPRRIAARLETAFAGIEAPAFARALLVAQSVADVTHATGLAPRALQRLCAGELGMPPRCYLRLLRFRDALADIHTADSLADTAAAQGYADQAHMAREFRSLAGLPPSAARSRAKGPFV